MKRIDNFTVAITNEEVKTIAQFIDSTLQRKYQNTVADTDVHTLIAAMHRDTPEIYNLMMKLHFV